MKDPYQVLRQKESDLERIRKEVEALRSVIPLLSEALERNDKERPLLEASALPALRTGGAD